MICESAGMVIVLVTAVPAETVVAVVVCVRTTKPPSTVSVRVPEPERSVDPKYVCAIVFLL
jgi:hypothetical protein